MPDTVTVPLEVNKIEDFHAPAPRETAAERAGLREALRAHGTRVVVVDDDPTGTQTVRDVPLVIGDDDQDLEWAVSQPGEIFAVLTNTRSMTAPAANRINQALGKHLANLSSSSGGAFKVISRGDSTLRGHFPGETEALAEGLHQCGIHTQRILVCPAYPEAGRVTANGVHWVRTGGRYIPAACSEFAQDPAFGYRSLRLADWIRERTGSDDAVELIGLPDIRTGGPARVAELLERSTARYVTADCLEPSDLDVVAVGASLVEQVGVGVIYRAGPSFVSASAGLAVAEPLSASEIATVGGRGLVVVGSYTSVSTKQLRQASSEHRLEIVWLDVDELTQGVRQRTAAVQVAGERLSKALTTGDAVLATTRAVAGMSTGEASLETASAIANALVSVTRAATTANEIDWLVAKGGITSYDLAAHALGARRAIVLGQLFPGRISVWRLGEGSTHPGLKYVVFPGNVGDESTLSETLNRLKGRSGSPN